MPNTLIKTRTLCHAHASVFARFILAFVVISIAIVSFYAQAFNTQAEQVSKPSKPERVNAKLPAKGSERVKAAFDIQQTQAVIKEALTTFYTPGMSVAVVHQGKVLMLAGEGLRNISSQKKVNAETYFRLGSTSKAFTAAAIGMLVEQGKIDWQDKVTQHLPEFQMQDPWVTREFTIKDLLVHHSGLAGGAGDSMIWPEPSGFTRTEVIANLRYLTPQSSFRSEYAYSNVLYITAGELIAKVSGESYGNFVNKHIFKPLEMDCFATTVPKQKLGNTAMSYAHNDAQGIYALPRNSIQGPQQMSVAAGGIVCNAQGMAQWIKALLKPELLPFSKDTLEKMWSAHTILGISESEEEWDGTQFKTYGYGWRIADLLGYKFISHTGTLSGFQAYVALVPELDLGVVLLNNGSNSGARSSVMQHILKSFIPPHRLPQDSPSDWVQAFVELQAEQEQAYLDNFKAVTPPSLPMVVTNEAIVGDYKDRWFGAMSINAQGNVLRIASERMLTLTGTVTPHEANRFKVEWDNKNAMADSFLIIETNFKNEVTGMKMHPFVSEVKERHAYRDMHFIKQ